MGDSILPRVHNRPDGVVETLQSSQTGTEQHPGHLKHQLNGAPNLATSEPMLREMQIVPDRRRHDCLVRDLQPERTDELSTIVEYCLEMADVAQEDNPG